MRFICGPESPRKKDSLWSNVVCLCASLSQVLVMGICQGFGVFLPAIMDEFHTSREFTAWIGSIAFGMSFCLSPVAGRLCDRLGSRYVAIIGTVFCSLGLILTSLARKVELFFLTHSVMFGLGACCCRTVNFLITAKYFVKRRSFATGLVTAGTGLGIFALVPIAQILIDNLGLSGAYRVLGGVVLANCLLALSFDPNVEEEVASVVQENTKKGTEEPQRNQQKLIDLSVWKVPTFAIVTLSFTGISIVLNTPQFHLVRFCKDLGIPEDKSSKLLMIYGLSSCVMRIASGKLCDIKWINPIYVYQIGLFTIAVAVISFGVVSAYLPLCVVSVFYGIGDGISLSLTNLLLLTAVEPERRASAFGLGNMFISISMTVGAPLAGFIADKAGSYELAFYIAGSMGMIFFCIPFILLCLRGNANQREEIRATKESDEV
ncbi:unnamed protein product [Pocillopora meandrina]|uniref:Major facilitator superfamily (MFS) profile domain-containing protein n=1 Tax=Pocillopora meandrina TaxID=46732 RepID=A0AAU9X8U6_9CNID|nr:unnamed protein product [Pocillopora meandrina]